MRMITKRMASILFLSVGTLLFFSLKISAKRPVTKRILSYNIRIGWGTDDKIDIERTAAFFCNHPADLVAVQEVDSVCPRSYNIDQLDYLAHRAGYYATFSWTVPYGRGHYGIGVMSKEKPLSVRRYHLPGKEQRSLLVCEFKDYVFACTHLPLQEENRLACLPIILPELERWNKPVVLCGDWNDTPRSKLVQEMSRHLTIFSDTTHFTFPSTAPTMCLDYMASRGSVKCNWFRVLHDPLTSDHEPIEAEVVFNAMKK